MKELMKSRKGAEMTIGTIVIIVLALIVLVVLIVGFTTGWGNLWGRITDFFSGSNNVDSIVSACNVACSTNAKYDYCERIRTLKYEVGDEKKKAEVTCLSLQSSKGLDKDGKLTSISGATVSACQSISCTACQYECNKVGTDIGDCNEGIDLTKSVATGKVCCKDKCVAN